ncbi:ribosome small subunit-dependent GTPase A [Thaumasiovibrio sp. DFM-14]|uniref:ribosome small subunit-dependent GTPase A n=1 Tax=Thaumasiovibrio sp. DFM-14 TaxID=3384792 RepID=UPI0039A0D09C
MSKKNITLSHSTSLSSLGWKAYFQQQLTLADYDSNFLARIIAHHRSGYKMVSEKGEFELEITKHLPAMTVGDWVVLEHEGTFQRLLERSSLFSRKAAGAKVERQLIAANVDTVFIVSSLNDDFNLSRIERYLVLAREAGVEPVVVLTKADLCDDAEEKAQQLRELDPMLLVESVNALDPQSVMCLASWCGKGNTVAFIGSSGVGKSTLVNTLLNDERLSTGGIREDDSKGRHTTTSRSMHLLPQGGLLLDTPGMRELQLADCADGVKETFADIEQYAKQCRFGNCSHESEPGCAVQDALSKHELDERRVRNYFKLQREQARNGASLAELRSNDKSLGKFYRSVQSASRQRKKGY